jgi:hypothetical protein
LQKRGGLGKNMKNIKITLHSQPLIKETELYEQEAQEVEAFEDRCGGWQGG